jgi:hypothetical protein
VSGNNLAADTAYWYGKKTYHGFSALSGDAFAYLDDTYKFWRFILSDTTYTNGFAFGTATSEIITMSPGSGVVCGTSYDNTMPLGRYNGRWSRIWCGTDTSFIEGVLTLGSTPGVGTGGLSLTGSTGRLTLNGKLNTPTAAPASATASGAAGDFTWDSSYFYVCTATNTWKRAALSTW